MPRKKKPKISQLVLSWPFVAFVLALFIGGGLTFMTSGHSPFIADVFFLVAVVFFLVAFFKWELIKRHPQKRHLLILVVLATMIVTGVVIWANHYLNDVKGERPDFVIEPQQMIRVTDSKEFSGTIVLANILVRNQGAESALYGWALSIKSDSISIDHIRPAVIPDGFTIKEEKAGKIIMQFNKTTALLQDKTSVPAQRGRFVSGWIRFDLPTVRFEALDKKTRITFYARDMFNREYSGDYWEDGTKIGYVQGSGGDPIKDYSAIKPSSKSVKK